MKCCNQFLLNQSRTRFLPITYEFLKFLQDVNSENFFPITFFVIPYRITCLIYIPFLKSIYLQNMHNSTMFQAYSINSKIWNSKSRMTVSFIVKINFSYRRSKTDLLLHTQIHPETFFGSEKQKYCKFFFYKFYIGVKQNFI